MNFCRWFKVSSCIRSIRAFDGWSLKSWWKHKMICNISFTGFVSNLQCLHNPCSILTYNRPRHVSVKSLLLHYACHTDKHGFFLHSLPFPLMIRFGIVRWYLLQLGQIVRYKHCFWCLIHNAHLGKIPIFCKILDPKMTHLKQIFD
jgi:hypothetical protein